MTLDEHIAKCLEREEKFGRKYDDKCVEKCKSLVRKIDEIAPKAATLRLKPHREPVGLFDSKLGGVPYFPKNTEYPTVRGGDFKGKPLRFLAQLNFEKLPKLDGFPEKGILQFFAGFDGDDVIGLDFNEPCSQNAFRVIYHENIITDKSKLCSENELPKFEFDGYDFPFKGAFILNPQEAVEMSITSDDYRFNKVLNDAYNDVFGEKINGIWDDGEVKGLSQVDEELCSLLCSVIRGGKTRMGGYPFFTQYDPRDENNELTDKTILLFQSDSENGGDTDNFHDEIMWGDMGVANFFISAEDLAKRDFSNVLYNWDCS